MDSEVCPVSALEAPRFSFCCAHDNSDYIGTQDVAKDLHSMLTQCIEKTVEQNISGGMCSKAHAHWAGVSSVKQGSFHVGYHSTAQVVANLLHMVVQLVSFPVPVCVEDQDTQTEAIRPPSMISQSVQCEPDVVETKAMMTSQSVQCEMDVVEKRSFCVSTSVQCDPLPSMSIDTQTEYCGKDQEVQVDKLATTNLTWAFDQETQTDTQGHHEQTQTYASSLAVFCDSFVQTQILSREAEAQASPVCQQCNRRLADIGTCSFCKRNARTQTDEITKYVPSKTDPGVELAYIEPETMKVFKDDPPETHLHPVERSYRESTMMGDAPSTTDAAVQAEELCHCCSHDPGKTTFCNVCLKVLKITPPAVVHQCWECGWRIAPVKGGRCLQCVKIEKPPPSPEPNYPVRIGGGYDMLPVLHEDDSKTFSEAASKTVRPEHRWFAHGAPGSFSEPQRFHVGIVVQPMTSRKHSAEPEPSLTMTRNRPSHIGEANGRGSAGRQRPRSAASRDVKRPVGDASTSGNRAVDRMLSSPRPCMWRVMADSPVREPPPW